MNGFMKGEDEGVHHGRKVLEGSKSSWKRRIPQGPKR